MDPRQIRKLILRWTPPVVLLAILGAAVAWALTRNQTAQYQAQGHLLVLGQVEQSALSLSPTEIIATDAALMTQPPALQRVIDDLHLPMTPDQLGGEVAVAQSGGTELINVTVTDPSPAQAAQIANAVMADFVSTSQAQVAAATQALVNQVQQQVALAKQQVQVDQTSADTAQRLKSGLAAAQAQLQSDTAQLTQLQTQLADLQRQAQQTTTAVAIAAPATAPSSPVATHRTTSIALGAFGGLLLGILLALMLQYMDQGLLTEEDVRRKLGLPTLGVIPVYSPGVLKRPWARRANSMAGEAYRRLRTNVLFSSLDSRLRSIVITSAGASEGKTRTAANLAGVMAAAGERVLLVDADMRRPMQHRVFGEQLEDGMSELLLQAAHSDLAPLNGRHHTGFSNLALLTAGTMPPNPSELLASKTIVGVLRSFEQQFDLVVLDTPPAQVVTDAVSLAATATGTILVIDPGRTNARLAMQTIENLRSVGANVLGVVLNKVKRRPLARYSYYYYYQYQPKPSAPPLMNGEEPVTAWVPVGQTRPVVPANKT